MKTKYWILFLFLFITAPFLKAQEMNLDSAAVAKVLTELTSISKNVDWADPKTSNLGFFYKAAPMIIYRGEDMKRAWKDFADYSNPDEKKGVDAICEKINYTVNQDPNYKIVQYFTKTESEGTWYVLMVTFFKKGVEKKAAFAFLKLGSRFGLGDID